MNLPVTDNGVRPAGDQQHCFYCHEATPTGAAHKPDCVCVKKSVVVEMDLKFVITVPQHWDKERIEFFINDSTSCANNHLNALAEWAQKQGNCICCAHETTFLRDATQADHETMPLACEEALQ